MAWAIRCWSLLRASPVKAWSQAEAGFWDREVKGNSSLQTALARQFLDDTCTTDWASIQHDIDGFYDSLNVTKLLNHALEHTFPAIVLAFEMLIHLGPRFIRDDLGVSKPIVPGRSIIAGIRGAVDLSRCALYNALHTAHHQFGAILSTESWVDDVVQRAEALARQLLSLVPKAAHIFKEKVEE